jgi:hypothetical protein
MDPVFEAQLPHGVTLRLFRHNDGLAVALVQGSEGLWAPLTAQQRADLAQVLAPANND